MKVTICTIGTRGDVQLYVVVPHIIDQSFWGQRVHELGVGPQAIPRAELSVEKLAQALTQATQDSKIRARAAHLGEQIRAETGIQNAVQLIESTIHTCRAVGAQANTWR